MITKKAQELAEEARNAGSLIEGQRLSRLAFDELFENCQPTYEEFTEFASRLVLMSSVLWKLILMIPQWEDANRDA